MTVHAHLNRTAAPLSALTQLSNGRHAWSSDVDKVNGSGDLAPDPHELLDSALAACTVLTLELYIRRRQMAVRDLQVRITHTEGKTEDGRVRYELQREIRIDGDLSEADRQRLMEIADRCPIHRLLTGEIHVQTRAVETLSGEAQP